MQKTRLYVGETLAPPHPTFSLARSLSSLSPHSARKATVHVCIPLPRPPALARAVGLRGQGEIWPRRPEIRVGKQPLYYYSDLAGCELVFLIKFRAHQVRYGFLSPRKMFLDFYWEEGRLAEPVVGVPVPHCGRRDFGLRLSSHLSRAPMAPTTTYA